MTTADLAALADRDYRTFVLAQRREMAELDRLLEEKDRDERAQLLDPHAQAVANLTALGVPAPELAWKAGAIATRVWLLEIASGGDRLAPSVAQYALKGESRWVAAPAFSPTAYEEWLLWQYVGLLADVVRRERVARKFGTSALTRADLEETRLRMKIPNDRWLAVRERAAWVLRSFEEVTA